MAILRRLGTQYGRLVSRGRGKPRLRGATGKSDKEDAEAAERGVRLAYAGKTSADKLHDMIDALSGKVHEVLPLASAWQASDSSWGV